MITNIQIVKYGRLGNQLFQFATVFNHNAYLSNKKLTTQIPSHSDIEDQFMDYKKMIK